MDSDKDGDNGGGLPAQIGSTRKEGAEWEGLSATSFYGDGMYLLPAGGHNLPPCEDEK